MTLGLTLFFYWLSLWGLNKYSQQAALKHKLLILFLVSPLVIYPFEFSPLWWLRGLTGDLSITTTALLLLAVYTQLFAGQLLSDKETSVLRWGIVVTGIIFYPLALGAGSFDPYVLGYGEVYFVALILLLSLVVFFAQYLGIAIVLAVAVLAWNVQLLQSVNLWDYLIDPFVFFFFLGRVVKWKPQT